VIIRMTYGSVQPSTQGEKVSVARSSSWTRRTRMVWRAGRAESESRHQECWGPRCQDRGVSLRNMSLEMHQENGRWLVLADRVGHCMPFWYKQKYIAMCRFDYLIICLTAIKVSWIAILTTIWDVHISGYHYDTSMRWSYLWLSVC
jgi:hypothetical protein